MNFTKSGSLKKAPKFCGVCRAEIKAGDEFDHRSEVLCEDCYMDIRSTRIRKTHWRYLGSIKNEYLIPGKNA